MSKEDNLREILGFDPESGERIEDRGYLKPIKGPNASVPPAIRAAFIEDCKRYSEVRVIKVFPEKLLHIACDYGLSCITRVYHLWEPPTKKAQKFPGAALAAFKRRGEGFDVREVSLFGEGVQHGIEWRTIIFDFNETTCRFDLQDRHICINYDENGLIESIPFLWWNESQDSITINDMTIDELLAGGSLKVGGGQSNYDFELIAEGEIVKVKRAGDEGQKEEILLRRRISREEIMEKIIDPQTLVDPINASPELDDKWRFANLMGVVGVKWEWQ